MSSKKLVSKGEVFSMSIIKLASKSSAIESPLLEQSQPTLVRLCEYRRTELEDLHDKTIDRGFTVGGQPGNASEPLSQVD